MGAKIVKFMMDLKIPRHSYMKQPFDMYSVQLDRIQIDPEFLTIVDILRIVSILTFLQPAKNKAD